MSVSTWVSLGFVAFLVIVFSEGLQTALVVSTEGMRSRPPLHWQCSVYTHRHTHTHTLCYGLFEISQFSPSVFHVCGYTSNRSLMHQTSCDLRVLLFGMKGHRGSEVRGHFQDTLPEGTSMSTPLSSATFRKIYRTAKALS